MADPLIVVDSSEIRKGKLEEVRAAVTELIDFVRANETEPLAYSVYFDDAGSRMTVLQIHPDSASMEAHLEIAGPLFQKFADLLALSRVDFYGRPSEALLGQMRQKAQLLGGAPVVVNEPHAGFTRFGSGLPPRLDELELR